MLQGGHRSPEPSTTEDAPQRLCGLLSTRVNVYVCWRFQFDDGDGGVRDVMGPSL